jgi:hypothetical protein
VLDEEIPTWIERYGARSKIQSRAERYRTGLDTELDGKIQSWTKSYIAMRGILSRTER